VLIHKLEEASGPIDPMDPRSPRTSGKPAAETVRELNETLDGADSKRTLDKMKSIGGRSFSRGLANVSAVVRFRIFCPTMHRSGLLHVAHSQWLATTQVRA
jgi:hypothetical protein